MKNITTYSFAVLVVLIAACSGSNSIESKKAELEKLLTQQAELTTKINALQEEISKSNDTTQAQPDSRAKLVAATAVSKQPFVHAIDVQGKVDGDENITYTARVPGTVMRILAKAGQRVSAGQVMAELDSKAQRAQLESMNKQYELVNTVYEKRKALWDQKVGSEIEFLQAKTSKESLEKQITAMKESLDMYTIKADFAGEVDLVNIKVGQMVSPGMPCIAVVNPDALKVKADISESNLSKLKTGNRVQLYFNDLNKSTSATVSHVSRTIDPMSRTFKIEIKLPNDADLHPNMVTSLKIVDYEKQDAIVVPVNAIQQLDGEHVVFVAVKQGTQLKAKKTVIQVGQTYNGLTEVKAGLNESDLLITTGFQDLVDGQTIQFN
ncbi:MAG: efflux RND transporter periplasmic adaptor subunit [Bacteroidota bacterium]|jgi:membrane fusion protein (multidrug efflux system)